MGRNKTSVRPQIARFTVCITKLSMTNSVDCHTRLLCLVYMEVKSTYFGLVNRIDKIDKYLENGKNCSNKTSTQFFNFLFLNYINTNIQVLICKNFEERLLTTYTWVSSSLWFMQIVTSCMSNHLRCYIYIYISVSLYIKICLLQAFTLRLCVEEDWIHATQ